MLGQQIAADPGPLPRSAAAPKPSVDLDRPWRPWPSRCWARLALFLPPILNPLLPVGSAAYRNEGGTETLMTPDALLHRAAKDLTVSRVFGEPIERDGVTLIPVAVVMGGGGGGSDAQGGSGGGFGGLVRGIGAYTIKDGQVRYRPAIDVYAVGLVTFVAAHTVTRTIRRRKRTKASAHGPTSPPAGSSTLIADESRHSG